MDRTPRGGASRCPGAAAEDIPSPAKALGHSARDGIEVCLPSRIRDRRQLVFPSSLLEVLE